MPLRNYLFIFGQYNYEVTIAFGASDAPEKGNMKGRRYLNRLKRKVVIIGGGVSGMATGIYLLKNGYDVEILEKNHIPGGACVGWDRNGCHIDGCIHWLVGTSPGSPYYKLWRETHAIERDTEIYFQDDFSVFDFPDGKRLTVWADLRRFRAELLELAPEDKREIERFVRLVGRYRRINGPVDMPVDMMSPVRLVSLGLTMGGDLMRVLRDGRVDCVEYARRFSSPYLKYFFENYMAPGYNLMSMLFMLGHVMGKDGGIPVGGSLAMSRRMYDYYLSRGGVYRMGKKAKRVIVENSRAIGVELSDGECVYADWVVSAVPAEHCLKTLLDGKYRVRKMDERYRDPVRYPIYTMTIPVYKCTADMRGFPLAVHAVTDRPVVMDRAYDGVALRSYHYDRTLASPSGSTVLQAQITGGDDMYFWWKSKRCEGTYRDAKLALAEEVRELIESRYPFLKGKLEVIDVVTPLTYERYLNSRHGSFQGFVHTSAGKSLMQKGVVDGLAGFVLSGQCIFQSGGLPVAVATGRFAAQRICRADHVRFRTRDYASLSTLLAALRRKKQRGKAVTQR